jgi:hypothetical protein
MLVAALIVLLACPSTDSIAGPPTISDITVSSKPSGDVPVGVDNNDESNDDGDADGVAGYTSKRGLGGTQLTNGYERQLEYVRLWWNLFFWIR